MRTREQRTGRRVLRARVQRAWQWVQVASTCPFLKRVSSSSALPGDFEINGETKIKNEEKAFRKQKQILQSFPWQFNKSQVDSFIPEDRFSKIPISWGSTTRYEKKKKKTLPTHKNIHRTLPVEIRALKVPENRNNIIPIKNYQTDSINDNKNDNSREICSRYILNMFILWSHTRYRSRT